MRGLWEIIRWNCSRKISLLSLSAHYRSLVPGSTSKGQDGKQLRSLVVFLKNNTSRESDVPIAMSSQEGHKPSTEAASAWARPKHRAQQSCPSECEMYKLQPEGHGGKGMVFNTQSALLEEFCSQSLLLKHPGALSLHL